MTADIRFSDTVEVTGIEGDELVSECMLRLSLRDSSQEDIPDFEGPTRQIETDQVLENYVEMTQVEDGTIQYTATAVFDDSGESFDVVMEVEEVAEKELQLTVTNEWGVNYHDRDSFMLEVKTIKKTHDALLEIIRDVVGAYHFDAEDISTVFDGPENDRVSYMANR